MATNSVLPGAEKIVIIILLALDASLVLNLGQLSSTLIVHAILQVTAHCAISLSHLSKHISLMRLLVQSLLKGSLFVGPVLTINLVVDLRLVVLLEPFSLLLLRLLQ